MVIVSNETFMSTDVRKGKSERGKRKFSFFNLHFSLSFILLVALLFGVSGAWANTYLSESRELDNDWTLNDTLSIAYGTSQSDTIVLDVGTWYLTINGNLVVGHNRKGELNLGTGNVSVIPAYNIVVVGDDPKARYFKSEYFSGVNSAVGHEPNHGVTSVDILISGLPAGKKLTIAVRPVSSLGTKGKSIATTFRV